MRKPTEAQELRFLATFRQVAGDGPLELHHVGDLAKFVEDTFSSADFSAFGPWLGRRVPIEVYADFVQKTRKIFMDRLADPKVMFQFNLNRAGLVDPGMPGRSTIPSRPEPAAFDDRSDI